MLTVKELLALRKSPFSQEQINRITKAYDLAKKAHSGQKRMNGEDYFNHSVETAATLIRMGLGSITTSAGLLHDVPEDTKVSLEDIKKEFGQEIAFIVEGVTKVGKVRLKGSADEEFYLENLRRMFLAMASDIRVVLIKLADRLHNMKTLYSLPYEKQQRIAKETMEIFVPIANRLGIGEIKGQLEDLAFKYLDPVNYNETVRMETEAYEERKKYTELAIYELKKTLKKAGVDFISIEGRAKYYYSFFLKLKKHEMDVNKVYDLMAIRIIVPTVSACYETLGIVHKQYRPMVGRIKDYISLPKPNGYKSIHTTVFGPQGRILEIQIRTERMNYEAEFGIAAHWMYSEKKDWRSYFFKKKGTDFVPEKELEWVKQLREWHRETEGQSDEFWSSIKIDFFKNHIFAFTPLGDVIDLPEKATTIDFAYRIHSDIGDQTIGARINGKIAPLDSIIHNGDVVEIMTTKKKRLPNRDWLLFAKTAQARSKIKQTLRKNGVDIL